AAPGAVGVDGDSGDSRAGERACERARATLMALLLYLAVSVAIVAAWHRFARPISKIAAFALIATPLCFTGPAMFTGRVYAPVDLPFLTAPLRDYAHDYGVPVHNA